MNVTTADDYLTQHHVRELLDRFGCSFVCAHASNDAVHDYTHSNGSSSSSSSSSSSVHSRLRAVRALRTFLQTVQRERVQWRVRHPYVLLLTQPTATPATAAVDDKAACAAITSARALFAQQLCEQTRALLLHTPTPPHLDATSHTTITTTTTAQQQRYEALRTRMKHCGVADDGAAAADDDDDDDSDDDHDVTTCKQQQRFRLAAAQSLCTQLQQEQQQQQLSHHTAAAFASSARCVAVLLAHNWPNCIADAFALEEVLGKPLAVLYFACNDDYDDTTSSTRNNNNNNNNNNNKSSGALRRGPRAWRALLDYYAAQQLLLPVVTPAIAAQPHTLAALRAHTASLLMATSDAAADV